MFARMTILAAGLGLLLALPALAADDTEAVPTLDQCKARFEACMDACRAANPDSSAGLAGCQARCAANRAACEAKAGYEKAKPWVQEQFENMEDFFKGFRDGPEGEEAPSPEDEVPVVPDTEHPEGDDGPYKEI